jgi:septum formation protein
MLYLASQSPRRQAILKDLGVQFELLIAAADEDAESLELVIPHEPSLDYVRRVTLAKLNAAVNRLKNRQLDWHPILCADTTVSIYKLGEDHILGKPKDDNDALEILKQLNHQCHQVHTAIAVQIDPESTPELLVSSSNVYFANNSPEKLKAYIATKEPMGKAGAYAIQGIGSSLIQKIEGSHSSIMGLPVYETCLLLDKASIPYILYL